MGNAPSLSVDDILSANEDCGASKGEECENIQKLEKRELEERLQSRGVSVSHKDNVDSLRSCLCLMESKGFWSKNAKLHPNFKRVKNWLWVHKRYRTQLDEMVNAVTSGHISKGAAMRRKLEAKIRRHSAFEDGELFKYFQENIKDEELHQNLAKLNEQHHKVDESLQVLNTLEKKEPTAVQLEEVVQKTKKYAREMREHLALEEDTILVWWLNLNQEQYSHYRSYLSFLYSFMY